MGLKRCWREIKRSRRSRRTASKIDDEVLDWVADALPPHEAAEDKGESVWSWGINIRRGDLASLLAMAGRYQEALALGEPYAERVAMLPEGDPVLLATLRDVYFALGAVYSGLRPSSRSAGSLGPCSSRQGRGDHYQIRSGVARSTNCTGIVLPYQTTRIDDRQRLVDIAQANLQRARGIFESDRPRYHPCISRSCSSKVVGTQRTKSSAAGLGSLRSDERWSAMVATGELARYQG